MPSISVGLPVYNGERFLRDAVESILAQDFTDFELIISDNASTDSTEMICLDYVKRDGRIRYHRQAENIGAARNYNDSFRRAQGRYFKWAAHDDRIAPSFLGRCVERLEADPGVAVAFAQMREIDADGRMIRDYDTPIVWNGATPASRIESLLCAPPSRTYIRRCVPITGLFRSDMLRRTRLIGGFGHADKVALVEIAMLGDFAEVPERLFLRRQHAGVSLAANRTAKELANWYDPENRSRIFAPRSRLFVEYGYAIARAPIGAAEKVACVRALLRLLSRDWRIFGGEIKQAIHQAFRLPNRTQRF